VFTVLISCRFIKEQQFERAGVFAYSGTTHTVETRRWNGVVEWQEVKNICYCVQRQMGDCCLD
jgi:hypothetical protein